jgi:hypothetical protein
MKPHRSTATHIKQDLVRRELSKRPWLKRTDRCKVNTSCRGNGEFLSEKDIRNHHILATHEAALSGLPVSKNTRMKMWNDN